MGKKSSGGVSEAEDHPPPGATPAIPIHGGFGSCGHQNAGPFQVRASGCRPAGSRFMTRKPCTGNPGIRGACSDPSGSSASSWVRTLVSERPVAPTLSISDECRNVHVEIFSGVLPPLPKHTLLEEERMENGMENRAWRRTR